MVFSVDLWSLSVLVSDLLELIVHHVESESFPISFSFLTFLIGFGILCYFSWRSTYIPEQPTAPTPPYVIQITTTPSVQGDGEVNSLRDIRVLSNGGGESDSALRRLPGITGVSRVRISDARVVNNSGETGESTNTTTTSDSNQTPTTSTTTSSNVSFATWSGSGEVQQRVSVPTRITVSRDQNHQQISQLQHQNNVTTTTASSAILEVLRPTISRPFLQRAVNQANLILYHRINVYHHHHHHHHYPQSAASSPTVTELANEEETQNNQDTDSSSPAPSSIPDPPNQVVENTQVCPNTTIEQTSEAEVQPVEIVLDSASSEDVLDIEQHSSEGLRQRRHVTFENPVDSEPTGTTETEVSMRETKKNGQTSEQARREEQSTTTNANQGMDDDIRFTIKFLDDTQMEVTSQAGEKVLDFKRRHFAAELSENKTVRLIFNGRVLDNDSSTLGELGIFEQCVVHCLIVNRQNPGGQSDGHSAGSGRDRNIRQGSEPGMFFVGFVGIFLVVLWFICFHFGNHLFSQSAVVSLTVLTAIFLIGLVAFYLPVHPANPA